MKTQLSESRIGRCSPAPALQSILIYHVPGVRKRVAGLSAGGPTRTTAYTFAAAPSSLSTSPLRTVLTSHVLGSQVLSAQIPLGVPIQSVAGQSISIPAGTPPSIRDASAIRASIVAVDARASTGVIHVTDKVLIPAL